MSLNTAEEYILDACLAASHVRDLTLMDMLIFAETCHALTIPPSITWEFNLFQAWFAHDPVAVYPDDEADFEKCITDFYTSLTSGYSTNSIRARGRSGGF